MAHPRQPRGAPASAALVLACLAAGACTDVDLEAPQPYDYASGAIAIVNPDWGVLPLPNDFLSPVQQALLPVDMPGVAAPATPPTRMALPVVDAVAAKKAQDLGYPVAEDSDLTKALLVGQNRLDGFIGSFAPAIPFSRPIDMDSLVPYDGTNGSEANFFFLDVTDPANTVPVPPDDYLRIFDWQLASQMPWSLSLRFKSLGALQPPADFAPGHTYAVVATGWTDKGIREALDDAQKAAGTPARPVRSDGPFLLFAAPADFPDVGANGTTYIGADGLARSGVVSGLDAARSLEGGRQITDTVLRLWEGLPGVRDGWSRADVVTAYRFTVATNPTPEYFNALNALLGGNAVVPAPADALDIATGAMVPDGTSCGTTLDFTLGRPVKADTVTNATVKLFRVDGATYTEVPLDVAVANAGATPAVTATPRAPLAANALHLAVVTSGILSADGTRNVADQTFFGVARAALLVAGADGTATFRDTPLLTYDEKGDPVSWNSPYLDSRLDTLILGGITGTPTPAALASAGQTLLKILSYLDGLRANLKPHLDWLVLGADGKPGTGDVVATREDVVLAWTFTTGDCGQQAGGTP